MITDTEALERIRSDWNALQRMRDYLDYLVTVNLAMRSMITPAIADVIFNLPVLLAFDVLRNALRQLRKEQRFVCPSRDLGPLVDCARDVLDWTDWQAIRDGVDRRNAIAHDGKLHAAKTCISDIHNAERQLIAWAIIDPAKVEKTHYTFEFKPD